MARPKTKSIEEIVDMAENLPAVEIKDPDIAPEHYKHMYECEKSANNIAQSTIENQREEINNQVKMYNKDIQYVMEMNKNAVNYARAKEDALIQILEGITALAKVDRLPIKPTEKEEEK